MIIAGFSGGAGLSLLAVMKEDVIPGALILVAPRLPELDKWEDEIMLLGKRGLRIWILCGDQDRDCLEGSKKLSSLLAKAGANVRLDLVENLEHDFPVDLEARLQKRIEGIPLLKPLGLGATQFHVLHPFCSDRKLHYPRVEVVRHHEAIREDPHSH